jgi:cell division protein FtsZ
MGIGRGFGKTRARDAALAAISSPLLDFPIERAKVRSPLIASHYL